MLQTEEKKKRLQVEGWEAESWEKKKTLNVLVEICIECI